MRAGAAGAAGWVGGEGERPAGRRRGGGRMEVGWGRHGQEGREEGRKAGGCASLAHRAGAVAAARRGVFRCPFSPLPPPPNMRQVKGQG